MSSGMVLAGDTYSAVVPPVAALAVALPIHVVTVTVPAPTMVDGVPQ